MLFYVRSEYGRSSETAYLGLILIVRLSDVTTLHEMSLPRVVIVSNL